MIHPSCLEVLATVQSTFSRDIAPKLKDVDARSAAATIEHLLRHIALRIEHEGALLTADITRTTALIERIAVWLERVAPERAADPRRILHAEARAAKGYRNLDQLGAAALALRGQIVKAQEALDGAAAADAEATALHQDIRTYIGDQLTDEARLIEPAFTGQGPRR